MKKIVVVFFLFAFAHFGMAQITNANNPAVLRLKNKSLREVPVIKMKDFDMMKVQKEDEINDKKMGVPYRFGYELDVNIDIKKKGRLDVLPNGDRLYRVFIQSKNAKTLNFVFDNYQIPKGAELYFYNEDRSDVLGAYTNIMNRKDKMLGTWMVQGDKICIEYFEPKEVAGKGELNLTTVVHGYRSVTDAEAAQKGLNDSGDCNQDVDCAVGADFDDIKDRLKHSVGFIIMVGSVCSGTLVNNTSQDGTPFFLTANHCDKGSESVWSFRFNWISQNPSCATVANSTDAAVNQTTSGATRLAVNSESDVRLLRLDGGLNSSWDLEYAGWDRSGDVPTSFVVGIHHPSGDIMKVCRENTPPTKAIIGFNGNASVEMWRVADWDLGVTEPGSSGSALFDANGRIIGQLAGGAAECNGTNDNNQFDVYGRFDISWDFGTSNGTRLSNWLDPTNTGATTVDSAPSSVLSVDDNKLEKDTFLYPIPTNGIVTISNLNNRVLDYSVYTVTGQKIQEGEFSDQNQNVDLRAFGEGMYFITIVNENNGESFTKKVIVGKK